MRHSEIETEYERLRNELEKAYAAPEWNTRLIDQIANAISRLEWASIRRSAFVEPLFTAKSSGMRNLDMSRA